jgi:ABC-type nitrate/sulfonate/bicarbonate transport system substrate-binding protein
MAAAILNPPFAIHARRAGLKDMGPLADQVGAYLGTVPYVLRGWAAANAGTLIAYLAACIEGLRWILDPANKAKASSLVGERLNAAPDVAAEILAIATDRQNGLAKDAAFDLEGLKTVLRLRASHEGREPSAPDRYFDLSYHRAALAAL